MDDHVFHPRQGTRQLTITLEHEIKQASLEFYVIRFWHNHSRAYNTPAMVLAFCTTSVIALYWALKMLFMQLYKDITFTMTVCMYTLGNPNHYHTNCCTLCYVLATIHYLRLMVKSSESPDSEIFSSVALFLTSKTYLKKSQPKTGRILGVQGSLSPSPAPGPPATTTASSTTSLSGSSQPTTTVSGSRTRQVFN